MRIHASEIVSELEKELPHLSREQLAYNVRRAVRFMDPHQAEGLLDRPKWPEQFWIEAGSVEEIKTMAEFISRCELNGIPDQLL